MLNQNIFFASESILILFEVWLLSPTTILHNFYKGIIMQSNWYEILCIPITNCNIVVLEKIFIVFCRYLFCSLLNLQNYRMTLTVYCYTSIYNWASCLILGYIRIIKHFPNFHLHCLFNEEIRNLISDTKEMSISLSFFF